MRIAVTINGSWSGAEREFFGYMGLQAVVKGAAAEGASLAETAEAVMEQVRAVSPTGWPPATEPEAFPYRMCQENGNSPDTCCLRL